MSSHNLYSLVFASSSEKLESSPYVRLLNIKTAFIHLFKLNIPTRSPLTTRASTFVLFFFNIEYSIQIKWKSWEMVRQAPILEVAKWWPSHPASRDNADSKARGIVRCPTWVMMMGQAMVSVIQNSDYVIFTKLILWRNPHFHLASCAPTHFISLMS